MLYSIGYFSLTEKGNHTRATSFGEKKSFRDRLTLKMNQKWPPCVPRNCGYIEQVGFGEREN